MFRYYDPNAGSYISQELIGLVGDNLTLYSYVSDPNRLQCIKYTFCIMQLLCLIFKYN